ncbi:MAG: helicase [Betaproteobacteria bacterium]|nr:helicase [Betaproteobacteria bacterium]
MAELRADPKKIATSVKEGVAEAILNIVHARVRGGGEFGRIIYGVKPSALLSSGFLLPWRNVDDGDEVTSPIWISGHGLDLLIGSNEKGAVRIKPLASIYLRVLPTEEDVKTRPDCKLRLQMRTEAARQLRQRLREAENTEWAPLAEQYKYRRECPDWKERQDKVREKVYSEMGLPPGLNLEAGWAEEPALQDAELPQAQSADAQGNEDGPPLVAEPDEGEIPQLRDEHFERIKIPHKWQRLELDLPELELDTSVDAAERGAKLAEHEARMDETVRLRLAAWLEDADPANGGSGRAYSHGAGIAPSQYRGWAAFLRCVEDSPGRPAIPQIELRWDISISPDWAEPGRSSLHVALENRSNSSRQHNDETEASVFQVTLDTRLPESLLRRMTLERVEASYRYNRYLTYPAIGYNGGVIEAPSADGLGSRGEVHLATTWMPLYRQPRIVPVSYPSVERGMRALANGTDIGALEAIHDAYKNWLAKLPAQVQLDRGIEDDMQAIKREEAAFDDHLKLWALEADAIHSGVKLLRESRKHWKARGPQPDQRAVPYEAWLAMNETMANLMKKRTEDDSAEWRLFQLAFILASLCSTASRMPEFKGFYDAKRDDAVTLLYFSTGGGKSEAFFGFLLFTLFLDRMRGKTLGVTAMVRYPLRLLTIQQAQRAAAVLAQAELVRCKRGYSGERFSIGFWVGSGGSPNRHRAKGVSDIPMVDEVAKEERVLRNDDANYDAVCKAWIKLPKCPFCDGPTGLRRFRDRGGTLAHVCTNPKCHCNKGGIQPLPFYICDDDIYDFAPSVLLGTVDKLALIGHSAFTIQRIMGMLGAAPWYDPTTRRLRVPNDDNRAKGPERNGCEKVFPTYEDGRKLFLDPFPSILIQDEAHLLDESLGTFAGLFESTLDTLLTRLGCWMRNVVAEAPDGKRRRAKVITATATVSDPERQLQHLYQRHVPALQFPCPGPDLHRSFYAEPEQPDEDETERVAQSVDMVEQRAKLARIYCGFMTNGRPHTTTTVSVLAAFHLTITEFFDALAGDDAVAQTAARNQLVAYLGDSPMGSTLSAKLSAATFSELATVVDLHRISLTYVTNKKGGDQVMSAETEEVRKTHLARGKVLDILVTRLITGSVEQGEIQATVQEAQTRVPPGEPLPPIDEALRSVIATSAISHGVDVEEFNSMFFAGMPSDIAEYIQASSRVGRTHVGLCVLIPTPQRRRDRYIIEVFDSFHRFLERMVQPAAIDRWATQAIQRVIPSLFQSYICGALAMSQMMRADDEGKLKLKSNGRIPHFLSAYRNDEVGFVDRASDFICTAIGLNDDFAPDGEAFYRAAVHKRVRELLEDMARQENESAALGDYFNQFTNSLQRPMTSLRDVDQAGQIRLAKKGWRGGMLDHAQVRDVLAFIRRGYAESGDNE